MERREVIKYTALLTGAAIGAPLFTSIMSGCSPEVQTRSLNGERTFFSDFELSLVRKIVDVILPKTDSPAASEMGVHKTIDTMVGTVYKKEDREKYRKGFEALSLYLTNQNEGKGFLSMADKAQVALLNKLETSGETELKTEKKAFKNLKQQTVAYYLSSEEISTKFLNYLPIPGTYEPCITLESVGGKAWAG